ncbi:unnamed protein product [Peniophora sp. CBMAI 1063]|nr:unnamed protein product [Peniophora sp. CBMAI 1063]
MLTSFIASLALLTVASVNGSPTIYDKRDPQFMVNLPNRLPVNGSIGFGITIGQGPNGNSVVTFGNGTNGRGGFPFGFFGNRFRGNTNSGTNTTNTRPFPFNFLPFKREMEMEMSKREPQFSFDFGNELPVLGDLPFGINIAQGADGNSIGNIGNATTGDRGFPLNFLPFKRDGGEAHQLVAREPQFGFNFTNRLPVTGRFPFGLNIGQGANGNSFAFFGNSSTGARPFPFNFLPFKRED